MASVWFPESERTFANAFMSLGNPIGIALVLAYAPAVAVDPSKIPLLNIITAGVSLLALLATLFVSNAPRVPPSASAAEESVHFVQGLKDIFKKWNYVLLLIIFGFYVGIFNVYVTLISDYIVPLGFTEVSLEVLDLIF